MDIKTLTVHNLLTEPHLMNISYPFRKNFDLNNWQLFLSHCMLLFSYSPLATEAEKDGVPVFKFPRWRVKGQGIPEVVDQYKATGAELNVLPFCSQFIPMEVIDHPKHRSIIYHPSLLPLHRGASAINWSVKLFFM